MTALEWNTYKAVTSGWLNGPMQTSMNNQVILNQSSYGRPGKLITVAGRHVDVITLIATHIYAHLCGEAMCLKLHKFALQFAKLLLIMLCCPNVILSQTHLFTVLVQLSSYSNGSDA